MVAESGTWQGLVFGHYRIYSLAQPGQEIFLPDVRLDFIYLRGTQTLLKPCLKPELLLENKN